MNKKFPAIVIMLAFSLLLTPLALAKPGAEKTNEKFDYFYLEVSGFNDGTTDRSWDTPPNNLEWNKTTHNRGGGWFTWPGANLTVGEETFTLNTYPYNITWTTTFTNNLVRFNNGTTKNNIIKLTDVVTLYDAENQSVGTLVLKLKSYIKLGEGGGNVMGYGTGVLEDVHVSAIDLGVIYLDLGAIPLPLVLYAREGTITGWPAEITND